MRLTLTAAALALASVAILSRPGTAVPVGKPAPLADKAHSAHQVKAAQQAWARYLKIPVEETVDLGGGLKLELVLIPPGTFWMGSPEGEKERRANETQHRVRLTKAFYLGKYEVTQAQYQGLNDHNPSQFKGANLPVELVSHAHALEFCEKAGRQTEHGHVYRLPTEAEWEYACRAGDFSKESAPFHFGAPSGSLSSAHANVSGSEPYGGADEGRSLQKTCAVGSYRPNRFGLYDMHGNVSEWCADWRGEYPNAEVTDPVGPERGSLRAIRGGGWTDIARFCRAADRGEPEPGIRNGSLGFRVARVLPGQ